MNVRMIRFAVGKQGIEVVRQVVDPAQLQPLAARIEGSPAVFLVSMSVVDSLVAQACLVDRSVKAKEIELGRYLLRVGGTPLVRASYASRGKLTNSLWTFLEGAVKAGECKVYFVAVPPELFEPQWLSAPGGAAAPAPAAPTVAPSPPPAFPQPSSAKTPAKPFDPNPSFLPAPAFDGTSPGASGVRRGIADNAKKRGPALISGEPGSGRTLVAELLHRNGLRADRPFLQVRCRGIPAAVQRRQVFGVPRGTMLVSGGLQLANSGTLLIQDFEWLPLELQAQLVRACLGTAASLDVRLVFISSLNLSELVARGRVDPDLAAALASSEIRIPSLSERPEDTPVIAAHMWRRITFNGAPLPTEILNEIQTQAFPNEADELYDVLVRLFVRSTDGRFSKSHFLAALHESRTVRATYSSPAGELFGVELDPIPEYKTHLEKCVNSVRDLWIAIRPIRHGRQSPPAAIVAAVPGIDAQLVRLDDLCGQPFRFVNAVLYHDVLDFKGAIMALRDAAAAEPGEIGIRWELALKVGYEKQYHDLNTALFDARDKLDGQGPDPQ